MCTTGVLGAHGGQKRCWVSWNWSCELPCGRMETEPRLSVKAASTLNHTAISPAPDALHHLQYKSSEPPPALQSPCTSFVLDTCVCFAYFPFPICIHPTGRVIEDVVITYGNSKRSPQDAFHKEPRRFYHKLFPEGREVVFKCHSD